MTLNIFVNLTFMSVGTQIIAGDNEMYAVTEEIAAADLSEHSSSTVSAPMQDYYDIQVVEEEVVSDVWNVDHTE